MQFDSIYTKYYKKLYNFLRRLSRDDSMAEELTQETMYKAFINIDRFEGRATIFTWLCQIGKNLWLKEMKRNNQFASVTNLESMTNSKSFEMEVIENEIKNNLRKAILGLPEPYQNVVILHTFAELSFNDIATQYEKSESWARVTYYRGKNMLMERMGRYEEK